MSNKENGNCYEVAGRIALNSIDNTTSFVCHGEVVGKGKIKGIVHGHAWIEEGDMVIDKSNGKNITMPKSLHYKIGQIKNVKRYTFKEAREIMLEVCHFGDW